MLDVRDQNDVRDQFCNLCPEMRFSLKCLLHTKLCGLTSETFLLILISHSLDNFDIKLM